MSDDIKRLSDEELLKRAQSAAIQERKMTVEVLKLIQEVERRELYVVKGFSSLFEFVTQFLGYSDAAAQRRVASARLMDEIPEVEEKIEEGVLTLSNLAQASSFFRSEAKNDQPFDLGEKREVLQKLEGKSTRQAKRELIAMSSSPPEMIQKEVVKPVSEIYSEITFVADRTLLHDLEKIRSLLAPRKSELSMTELIAEMAAITLKKLQSQSGQKREAATGSQNWEYPN